MNDRRRIMIVDDEPQITRVLRTSLGAQGYDIRVANDGEMALEIMRDWTPHLLITDLAMPNLDGVSLCRRVRVFSALPIIVLSVREQERVKIEALDAGADDYVTKPFNINELSARIRAHLRRAPDKEATDEILERGAFRIDLGARRATVAGRDLRLTPKEFELLAHLAHNPHKTLSHRALLAAVWGGSSTEQPEYLRVFIGQLRKKIEVDPANPQYILTEPWVGYRFEPGE